MPVHPRFATQYFCWLVLQVDKMLKSKSCVGNLSSQDRPILTAGFFSTFVRPARRKSLGHTKNRWLTIKLVWSAWLNSGYIRLLVFGVFIDLDFDCKAKNRKKKTTWPISSDLDLMLDYNTYIFLFCMHSCRMVRRHMLPVMLAPWCRTCTGH